MSGFYVYRFLDAESHVIYVGRTNSIHSRIKQHFGNQGHLPIGCYNSVDHVEFIELKTKNDMKIKELYYIGKWKPIFNKVDVSSVTIQMNDELDDWKLYNKFRKETKDIHNAKNSAHNEHLADEFYEQIPTFDAVSVEDIEKKFEKSVFIKFDDSQKSITSKLVKHGVSNINGIFTLENYKGEVLEVISTHDMKKVISRIFGGNCHGVEKFRHEISGVRCIQFPEDSKYYKGEIYKIEKVLSIKFKPKYQKQYSLEFNKDFGYGRTSLGYTDYIDGLIKEPRTNNIYSSGQDAILAAINALTTASRFVENYAEIVKALHETITQIDINTIRHDKETSISRTEKDNSPKRDIVNVRFHLKRIMKESGVTQTQLAEMVGVRQATISQLCSQHIEKLHIPTVEKIAESLSIRDISTLMTFD